MKRRVQVQCPKKPKNNGRLDNKDDGNAKSGEGARKGRVSAY